MRFKGEGAQPPRGWSTYELAPTGALSLWADSLRKPLPETSADDDAPERDEPFYMSADSTPAGYAVRRSPWIAPAFLVALAASSALLAADDGPLARGYARFLGALTGTSAAALGGAGATVSIRPFALVVFLLVALLSAGSLRCRARILLTGWGAYAVVGLGTDVVLVLARPLGTPGPLSPTGGVIAAIAALAAAVVVVFTQYTLPPGIRVPTVLKRPWWRAVLFTGAFAAALFGAIVVRLYRESVLPPTNLPGLATLASGTVVLVAALQLLLFLAGSVRRTPVRRHRRSPSIGFIVPAYNEEASVTAVIMALDAAAAGYDGECRLYLVDNASTDRTAERARAALAACTALDGEVLRCSRQGKSYALNLGLDRTTEEIVVRVDADTLVPPTLLVDVVPYFEHEDVGGVSGIPLPREDTPRLLNAMRLMEVFYSVSFLRTGQNSVDATLVMPGNMSAYRGEIVRALGGFAAGFNGEDTDIAVRIGRLGYRIVTDPRIRFRTEVPASIGHLMEQRLRWTRGMLYVAARNKSSLVQRQGLRGMLLLPWSTVTTCRRSLTVPLLVCVGAASAVDPSMLALRQVAVVGGAAIGAHMLLVALLLVVRGRVDALLFLPVYALFRVFKLYVAFCALLTLEPKHAHTEQSWRELLVAPAPA